MDEKVDKETLKQCLYLILEYAINKLLVDAKFESWVVLFDYEGIGMTNAGFTKSVKKILKDNPIYNSRCYRYYSFHQSSGFKIRVSLKQKDNLMTEFKKVKITSKNCSQLWSHLNPKQ